MAISRDAQSHSSTGLMRVLAGLVIAPILLAPMLLGGCATGIQSQPDFNSSLVLPKTNGSTAYTDPQYISRVQQKSPTSCDIFDSSATPTTPQRNACIQDLMTDIDAAYRQYEITVSNRIAGINGALDGVALLAGTAAPATTGTAAKVLSGIAAVATGGKNILSQDLFYKQSLQVLLSTMQADRANESAGIHLSMQLPLASYPMEQAKNDLLAYLYAGTLPNALVAATQNAGSVAQKCKAVATAAIKTTETGTAGAAPAVAATKPDTGASGNATTADQCSAIAETLTASYDYTSAGKALDAFWKPNGKDFDAAHQSALQSCLSTVLGASADKDVKGIATYGDLPTLINTHLVSEADKTKILVCAFGASPKASAN